MLLLTFAIPRTAPASGGAAAAPVSLAQDGADDEAGARARDEPPTAAAGGPDVRNPAVDPAAQAVFDSITAAWSTGDVDALLEHFGPRKVVLSLLEAGPASGAYSRSQIEHVLEAHFATVRTLAFEFVHVRTSGAPRHTAVGLANRTYRDRSCGIVKRDRLLVTLTLDDDRWVVCEIRAVQAHS